MGRSLWVFNEYLEVKGVVEHRYPLGADQAGRPRLYFPYAFVPTTLRTSMLVRTDGDPEALLPDVRRALAAVDPLVPVADIKSLRTLVRESTAAVRFTTAMLGGFAAAALLLAILGVHGVLAFSVAQQRRQIAVRVAIGGTPARVAALVLGHAARIVGVGALLGICAGWPLARAVQGGPVPVQPADPWALVAAGAGIVAMAIIASLEPLRRATTIQPGTVLRGE